MASEVTRVFLDKNYKFNQVLDVALLIFIRFYEDNNNNQRFFREYKISFCLGL